MSATTKPQPALRPMLPADGPLLQAIFQASVDELAAEDYDDEQRAAWAGAADDEDAFFARLGAALTLVATLGGAPVGFIALEGTSIAMLYVHPGVARRGVATLLCGAVETLAAARKLKELTVDASDTAQPFFATRGFGPLRRQTVMVGDCWFGNTHMVKALAPGA